MGEEADAAYENWLGDQALLDGAMRHKHGIDLADLVKTIEVIEHRKRKGRDWHPRWKGQEEPECASNQWRTRNRQEVIDMSKMGSNHLMHAIRFASTKKAHASRLAALLAEKASRK